jgi:hypothetical protein
MINAKDKIRLCVNDFVTVLSDLVREATVAEIVEAVKRSAERPSARPAAAVAQPRHARDARGVAGRKPGPQAKAPIAAARGGQQRTPELLAQLMGRVHGHINANPGLSVGAIAVSLGTATKELSLVLRKLLDEKKVVSKGKKRGTRYFPR